MIVRCGSMLKELLTVYKSEDFSFKMHKVIEMSHFWHSFQGIVLIFSGGFFVLIICPRIV